MSDIYQTIEHLWRTSKMLNAQREYDGAEDLLKRIQDKINEHLGKKLEEPKKSSSVWDGVKSVNLPHVVRKS